MNSSIDKRVSALAAGWRRHGRRVARRSAACVAAGSFGSSVTIVSLVGQQPSASAGAASNRGQSASPFAAGGCRSTRHRGVAPTRRSPTRRAGASSRPRIVSADPGITGLNRTAASRVRLRPPSTAPRRVLRPSRPWPTPTARRRDVLVGGIDEPERRLARHVERQTRPSRDCIVRVSVTAVVREPLAHRRAASSPLPVTLGHRRHAVDEVPQVVRQINVVLFLEAAPAEVAVRAEDDLLGQKQPQRIGAKPCRGRCRDR